MRFRTVSVTGPTAADMTVTSRDHLLPLPQVPVRVVTTGAQMTTTDRIERSESFQLDRIEYVGVADAPLVVQRREDHARIRWYGFDDGAVPPPGSGAGPSNSLPPGLLVVLAAGEVRACREPPGETQFDVPLTGTQGKACSAVSGNAAAIVDQLAVRSARDESIIVAVIETPPIGPIESTSIAVRAAPGGWLNRLGKTGARATVRTIRMAIAEVGGAP